MYFDGSLKPPRVVRLSGASYLEKRRNNKLRLAVLKHDSISRTKAILLISNFCRLLSARKVDLQQLAIDLPLEIKNARSYLSEFVNFNVHDQNLISTNPVCKCMRIYAHVSSSGLVSQYQDSILDLAFKFLYKLKCFDCASQLDSLQCIQFRILVFKFLNSNVPRLQLKPEHYYITARLTEYRFTSEYNVILFARILDLVLFLVSLDDATAYINSNGWYGHWFPHFLLYIHQGPNNASQELLEFMRSLGWKLGNLCKCETQRLMLPVLFWTHPQLNWEQWNFSTLVEMLDCTLDSRLLVNQKYAHVKASNLKLTQSLKSKLKHALEQHSIGRHLFIQITDSKLYEHVYNDASIYNVLRFTLDGDQNSTLLVYEHLFCILIKILIHLDSRGFSNVRNLSLYGLLNLIHLCLDHFPFDHRPVLENHGITLDLCSRLLLHLKDFDDGVMTLVQMIAPIYRVQLQQDWMQRCIATLTPLLDPTARNLLNVESCDLEKAMVSFEDSARLLTFFLANGITRRLLKMLQNHFDICCQGDFTRFYLDLISMDMLYQVFILFQRNLLHAMSFMYRDELFESEGICADETEIGNLKGIQRPYLLSNSEATWLLILQGRVFWFKRQGIVGICGNSGGSIKNTQPTGPCRFLESSCILQNDALERVKMYTLDLDFIGLVARRLHQRFNTQGLLDKELTITAAEKLALKLNTSESWEDILTLVPYILSFHTRLELLYRNIANDKRENRNGVLEYMGGTAYIIRRNFLVEDAMATLGTLDSHELKQIFKVVFVDKNGIQEQGVDGGGLFKEFLISVCTLIFDPGYGIFEFRQDSGFCPNPNSGRLHPNHFEILHFIGKIIGKAIYEGIYIEPVLSRLVLNLILRRRNTLDDLHACDPELFYNLQSLRKMTSAQLEAMDLNFSFTATCLDSVITTELIPNGSTIQVDKENLEMYIQHYCDNRCNRSIGPQCAALLSGLEKVIPLDWLEMFSPLELELVISGCKRPVNIDDLRCHTSYSGGFTAESPTIVWFWEILANWDQETVSQFLYFVTCSKRVPLQGFKQLQPNFGITKDPISQHMPTVSTCLNLLKVPEYKSKAILEKRLVDAMNMSQGFGLY
ncbi:bifunctional HECT domain/HECT [Babesia duncani]|uniref:HECT-type E3 ubiquitin transferase n=1 Tax=Babesia duncani TaxID=323732 RepID=A0AAD9UN05_9APIC|nr:bifunctional HECT domain/HECT [Babesia duncani]